MPTGTPIDSLVVEVGADVTGLDRGVTAAKKASDTISASLSNMRVDTRRLQSLDGQMVRLQGQAARLQQRLGQVVPGSDRAQRLERDLRSVQQRMGAVNDASGDLRRRLSGINEVSFGGVVGRLNRLNTSLDQTGKTYEERFGRIGGIANTAGNAMLGLSGASLLASGYFAKAAMGAVENESLFEVTYAKNAQAARNWSNNLAETYQRNAYAVRNYMGQFAAVLKPSMGLEQATVMSERLTQLAYDIESFRNVPIADVIQALQSGMAGEAEAVRRFGIDISEAQLKTVAAAHGIAKYGAETDEATKRQVRYWAILEQTTDAQGDVTRTMDSPTNKLRALTERWEQLRITIGQGFIPIIDKVLTAMKPLSTALDNMTESQKKSYANWILWGAGISAFVGVGLKLLPLLLQWRAYQLALAAATAAETVATNANTGAQVANNAARLRGLAMVAGRALPYAAIATGAYFMARDVYRGYTGADYAEASQRKINRLTEEKERREALAMELSTNLATYQKLKASGAKTKEAQLELAEVTKALNANMRESARLQGKQPEQWDGSTAAIERNVDALQNNAKIQREVDLETQRRRVGKAAGDLGRYQASQHKAEIAWWTITHNPFGREGYGPMDDPAFRKRMEAEIERARQGKGDKDLIGWVREYDKQKAILEDLKAAATADVPTPDPTKTDKMTEAQKKQKEVWDKCTESIKQAVQEEQVLGAAFDLNAAKASAYQTALEGLLAAGAAPDDPRVKKAASFVTYYDQLQKDEAAEKRRKEAEKKYQAQVLEAKRKRNEDHAVFVYEHAERLRAINDLRDQRKYADSEAERLRLDQQRTDLELEAKWEDLQTHQRIRGEYAVATARTEAQQAAIRHQNAMEAASLQSQENAVRASNRRVYAERIRLAEQAAAAEEAHRAYRQGVRTLNVEAKGRVSEGNLRYLEALAGSIGRNRDDGLQEAFEQAVALDRAWQERNQTLRTNADTTKKALEDLDATTKKDEKGRILNPAEYDYQRQLIEATGKALDAAAEDTFRSTVYGIRFKFDEQSFNDFETNLKNALSAPLLQSPEFQRGLQAGIQARKQVTRPPDDVLTQEQAGDAAAAYTEIDKRLEALGIPKPIRDRWRADMAGVKTAAPSGPTVADEGWLAPTERQQQARKTMLGLFARRPFGQPAQGVPGTAPGFTVQPAEMWLQKQEGLMGPTALELPAPAVPQPTIPSWLPAVSQGLGIIGTLIVRLQQDGNLVAFMDGLAATRVNVQTESFQRDSGMGVTAPTLPPRR